MKLQRLLFLIQAILMLLLCGSAALGQMCEGQGNAAMIVKGRCVAGFPLKFKLSGLQNAKYKVYMAYETTSDELGGNDYPCLDFGPQWRMLAGGRLNNDGLRSFEVKLPDAPGAVGRRVWLQTAVEDPDAPNGIALTNSVGLRVCSECPGHDPCENGIARLGFLVPVEYDGETPVLVQVLAFKKSDESAVVGSVDLVFDPSFPPQSQDEEDVAGNEGVMIEYGAMEVRSIKQVAGRVVVHAMLDATESGLARLPRETTLRVSVGDSVAERRIHSSCSLPIGVGSYFAPFVITYMDDVGN